VTSPSILLEDKGWLERQPGNRFVDPEIGHMGNAAHTANIEFGFLHVISNTRPAHTPPTCPTNG
jgi:hypothetical protein